MTANNIEIAALTRGPRDVSRFLNLGYAIYGDDPNWVAPLLMDVKKVFTDENPLFQHAEAQLWIAVRGGKDVGRIAGIIDRTHNEVQKDRAAFFGFFECVNDPAVSGLLFRTVRDWARSKGMRRILGPMNPTTNDECGLLIDAFDSPPVLMMTYNPPYYVELFAAEGLRKAKDLLAYHMKLDQAPLERIGRIAAATRRRHPELTFKPVRAKSLKADLGKVKEVYNAAWEANWGFVPMTDAEIDFMAARLKPMLVEGLLWIVETPTEAVGFLLGIPDFNVVIKPLRGRLLSPGIFGFLAALFGWRKLTWVRAITLGVKPHYRNRGIEAVMLAESYRAAARLGITDIESSWILEDNPMMRRILEVFGGRVYKTYRLYEREA